MTEKKEKTRYFKFLLGNNLSPYADFDYTPYLPKNGKPGKWLPIMKTISMCSRGYHACKAGNCGAWAENRLFEVELRGRIKGEKDNKVVAQQMRFLKKVKFSPTRFYRWYDNADFGEDDTDEEKEVEKYILKLADKS